MKNDKKIRETPAAQPVMGQPETAADMVNKYGTYEIQPTADTDTDNEFPAIAQGLSKKQKKPKQQ